MNLRGKTIGFGLTGSHCTFAEVMPEIKKLVDEGANVIPILSYAVQTTDTRFGATLDWQKQLKDITGNQIIMTIVEAEPVGPKGILDLMVIAPATGNTVSKLANAITDSPVLMAAKGQLRNLKPVVVAVSTNDGLGLNGVNIGRLLATKNIFLVPFGQDSPTKKPNSLVARMDLIKDTCEEALDHKQIQPVLVEKFKY
ncbi:dipicolinate synthase subunit B [Tepidibacillus infernus]|uniref:Dipicolinate synthase subunit B n=1 Tax=Tepidibacillus decaturensis TaxID=1413211 RepID=A0A135L325_9BACI|nr:MULTISPECIES: dipicolinate synthase subunit B [Tepidibacillus]KXG43438.1 dipicolinate synthase subunit B [Tepidibacillus decaturensis]GBF11295.1 dipicolinate synthase subunit B [Tepidibacillus sp. HK-1]